MYIVNGDLLYLPVLIRGLFKKEALNVSYILQKSLYLRAIFFILSNCCIHLVTNEVIFMWFTLENKIVVHGRLIFWTSNVCKGFGAWKGYILNRKFIFTTYIVKDMRFFPIVTY